MSGECELCHEHCLDCKCNIKSRDFSREKIKGVCAPAFQTTELVNHSSHIKDDKVCISQEDLLELIYWARRYCDGRATYAPSSFNNVYRRIRSAYPDLLRCKDEFDNTLKDKGAYWPYAQDDMYDPNTGSFDARR